MHHPGIQQIKQLIARRIGSGHRNVLGVIERCPSERIRRVGNQTIEGKQVNEIGPLYPVTRIEDLELRREDRRPGDDVVGREVIENRRRVKRILTKSRQEVAKASIARILAEKILSWEYPRQVR